MTTPIATRWILPDTPTPSAELLAVCSDPLIARLLINRGLSDPNRAQAFLSPDHYVPTPPDQMPNLIHGAKLLADLIRSGVRILIWGDFDVDGQTSTAILYTGLSRLGADVVYHVPDRATEGHGIRLDVLQKLVAQHDPQVLVTCDTGIREFEAVDWVRQAGLTVIVTDHHELGDHLPDADAVINPRLLPSDHPFWTLPGAGAAYLLMQETYRLLHPNGAEGASPLLGLAAIGIIGDVATLHDEARYYVQRGVIELQRGQNTGLSALATVAALPLHELTATHIGYQFAPRMNAAGRLHSARLGVELLTTSDTGRAAIIAAQMEAFNNERKLLTQQIDQSVEELIAATPALLNEAALVLHHANWHAGLVGIVAARVSERYSRPVILLAGSADGIARGSGRAPIEDDITAVIAGLNDLILSYGGHPGAAGVSLYVDRIPEFRRRFANAIRDGRAAHGQTELTPSLSIDAVLTIPDLTVDLPRRLNALEPFGEGNPAPVFCIQDVELTSHARLGRQEQHRRLTIQARDERSITVLWWNSGAEKVPNGRFDVAVKVGISSRAELEVILQDWHLREAAPVIPEIPPPTIHDRRSAEDPFAALYEFVPQDSDPAEYDTLVWAEGYSRASYPHFRRRVELEPAHRLIIFSAPSDPVTLRKAIQKVTPREIILINAPSLFSDEANFLSQLATAAQNVLKFMDGSVKLDVLCGAVAGSPEATFAGLEFLAASQVTPNLTVKRGTVKYAVGEHPDAARPNRDDALIRLRRELNEMAAYRRHARVAALDVLSG